METPTLIANAKVEHWHLVAAAVEDVVLKLVEHLLITAIRQREAGALGVQVPVIHLDQVHAPFIFLQLKQTRMVRE